MDSSSTHQALLEERGREGRGEEYPAETPLIPTQQVLGHALQTIYLLNALKYINVRWERKSKYSKENSMETS